MMCSEDGLYLYSEKECILRLSIDLKDHSSEEETQPEFGDPIP